MSKRNRRIPKDVSRIDFKDAQVPVDISIIGSNDDPCFGKLYEPITEECHACGDSELCAIVHMHTLDKKRKKVEKSQTFKDTEEAVKKSNFMSLTKLRQILEKKIKKGKKVRFSVLVKNISSKYDPKGLLPHGRVSELCKFAVKSSNVLKKSKINGKIYIKRLG